MRNTRLERSEELPAGYDIHSASLLCHEAENCKIGVRLHGKGNHMGYVLEGPIVRPEMTQEGRVAVDIAGRADLFRNPTDRNLLAIELALSILEVMHPENLH